MKSSSVHKVLDILMLFGQARPELKVEEIADETDMPLSTVYRYVRILCDRGFLEKFGGSSYRLGLRFIELSHAVGSSNRDLRLIALPSMKRIADEIDETVSLMRLFDRHAICIESIEGKQVVRVVIERGRLQPIYAGASSKVLLASLDEDAWDTHLTSPLRKLTPNTITNRDAIKAELRTVRQQGYAMSNGEIDEGGRAVAVPVSNTRDEVIAALSVEGPHFRMRDDMMANYVDLLQFEAERIRQSFD